ncbi:MAG: MBOAT family protein [Oligoflexia bacterium]|nr:MBOAT family protein [Oligoflexia bacterium]
MLFNSIEYLLFLPCIFFCYYLLPYQRRWILLLAASYFYYLCWNFHYLWFLVGITLTGYLSALLFEKYSSAKKLILLLALFFNLGVLFTFKYLNFSISTLTSFPALNLILPIGISFYIFQSVGYLIDVYRGDRMPEKNLGIYALYVSFFPQLLAGPIGRSNQLIPQLTAKINFNYSQVVYGAQLFLWGLFKKLVIADRLKIYVDTVYASPESYQGLSIIMVAIFFTFQVYCDFSAYSDMAIGSAQMFGIQLINNFQRPFYATSISDFWRRWHISLSSWLQDYVFKPLTIATRDYGRAGLLFSVLFTNLLIGLWHGANWTFIVFGLIQGLAISAEILTKKFRKKYIYPLFPKRQEWVFNAISMFYTFSIFSFSLIFFRANSIADAKTILSRITLGWSNLFDFDFIRDALFLEEKRMMPFLIVLFLLLLVEATHLLQERQGSIRSKISNSPLFVRWSLYYTVVLAIIFLGKFGKQQFIYFQF